MRLLDYDPWTGLKTYFKHDPETNKNYLYHEQDVQGIIETNKFEASALNRKGNWWKIGTIPNVILIKWANECGHPVYSKEWQEYAKKQLNSSEYSKFNVNRIKL